MLNRNKRILFGISVCIITAILPSCSIGDKTITMNEDVYMEEIENSSKITSEEINIEVEEGFKFEPGFFQDGKVYGVLINTAKSSEGDVEGYSAYYSKEDNLVKLNKLTNAEIFSNMNYNERRIYNWKNKTFKDVVTGEEKSIPEVKIDFTSDTEGIRVVASEESNNKVNNNYDTDYIDKKYYGNERSMKNDQYYLVKGNDNYFYRQITNFIYEEEEDKSFLYRTIYGKRDLTKFKSVDSIIVLYDYENNKAITFDGKFSSDFPILSNLMYSKEDNKIYAIGGSNEDEIYEININDDTYSLDLVYKFDLGDKTTTGIWNSKIIGGSLLIESFKPDGSEDEFIMTEEETMLLDLNSKEINVIQKNDQTNFLMQSNSSKYVITINHEEGEDKSRILLGKVHENKVEYIYEFEEGPIKVVFDDDEKNMFVQYGTWKDDNTVTYRYVLYNLDIE
ncbi:MAG: hypothetical protein KHZ99_02850 [Clostridium sp.]|uniref:hypothetical protein n=1 Tax=Clostridium sp. TaxID=1506 RepID=UPI0025BB0F9D|nr:hypothetical protein [Clostridium sp.]MBS4955979.1 hypothetical protein [Clostridium sp.]